MSDDKPTQPTQPKGIDPETGRPYEPVEIPVPKREEFLRDLKKVAPSGPQPGKSAKPKPRKR